MKSINWKDKFKEGKELILSTSSLNGKPNANIVISLGLIDQKILIANCQMRTTIKNLIENKEATLLGGYYRIKGKAKLYTSGKYFDICVKKSKGYKVKTAILITIKKVTDLDTQKVLF